MSRTVQVPYWLVVMFLVGVALDLLSLMLRVAAWFAGKPWLSTP